VGGNGPPGRTLTENTLYTVEAFNDYLDHLTDDGVVTMTRWVIDGLRLVSLAQEAGAARGWDVSSISPSSSATACRRFLLKKSGSPAEIATLTAAARQLEFNVIYAPTFAGRRRRRCRPTGSTAWKPPITRGSSGPPTGSVSTTELQTGHPADDRRSAVLLSRDGSWRIQFQVAFGRSVLFGNGLSALLTLMGISTALVVLFVLGPLAFAGRRGRRAGFRGWCSSAHWARASC
jgi:hypothetical protein